MKKKGARRRQALAPQLYQPRCEIALETLMYGLAGTTLIARYLDEQSGPDWRVADDLLDTAERDLRKALFWLRKRKKL